ncbi:YwaF family protein [Neobacillus drentensis]|uniref:YwaF family protein n=1 Tax=Neobacillus drentensis TaxID=220684 RepID=UPI002FFF9DCE
MFSVTEMRNFTLFSIPHIVTLILFFFTCCALVYYKKKLKPYKPIIKWILFGILLVCEISQHLWLILTNKWGVDDLPLQLCSISTFLALFLYLKNNQKAFNLLFFIGTLPPILSMITPGIVNQFPHFRFIRYFLQHSAIPLSVLYFIHFEGYRIPRKGVLFNFLTVNMIAVPIFFLNQKLGTNFFFLANPTETKTILSFLGSGIMYYINLEIAALLLFIITYILMDNLQKIENKSINVEKKIGESE